MQLALVFLVLSYQAFAQIAAVDPAGATLVSGLGVTITGDNNWTTATSAWNKTEWDGNGNLESWAATDITPVVEAGNNLSTWTVVFTVGVITSVLISGVEIQKNAAAPDTITVTVPNNAATSKFARLRVLV